ncbi:death effector domain-containing 1 [Periophthalmus magnuspinnatus]|uniref:death effector domain-containing 1 n=1 Tax=Periophthalmus magnuspinnatus TaxID=409849 RepID=UPI00145BE9E5|nr:death effector domain-containing 1 [Periophthalmus magnuspinnatus]XP_055083677.1 death effector domain-containing 1 [Periophthalmus magnuspinnatus]
MAIAHRLSYPFRNLHCWEENECLNYYGLLSLHEVFEIVGSQLTETDIEVLSFLLNETCTVQHPLDPTGWTVEPSEDDPDDVGVRPSPQLLNLWRRFNVSTSPQPIFASHKPKSGLELLLELEKRGYISEGNLEPLLQLLRVLTRHDLLPFVSHKRRRTVSPERIQHWRGAEHREVMFSSGMPQTCRATEMPLSTFTPQGRSGLYSPVPGASAQKRRRKRGNGWSRKPKKLAKPSQPPPPPVPQSVSCDVRLRVRAEYLEHESALRNGVASDKRQPLERQFELFSQANSVLRSRNLGSIVCDIKFTELGNLHAFWADYQSGALLEALKGVFITDSLRSAAGSEGVRLLISVDQDDYEEGCRLLMAGKGPHAEPGQGQRSQMCWTV